jgi:hypothetical protein
MTTNVYTLYVKKYHAKQNAMGLCRSCPRPLAEGSTQLCEVHLGLQRKQQLAKNIANGAIPAAARKVVDEALTSLFNKIPNIPLETVGSLFNLSRSTLYDKRAMALGMPPAKIARTKIITLLRTGPDMQFKQIAEEAGVSLQTVFITAKRFGFPTRVRKPYRLKANN